MRLVRTILALAIALSLAMLPLGASTAGLGMADAMQPGVQAETHAGEPMGMHMASHAGMPMAECCPEDTKGAASHAGGDKCGMGFCCIGGAIALGDVRMPAFAFFAVTASRTAIPADQVVSFRGGSPPFRPPRI
jgi:hypothetical protein